MYGEIITNRVKKAFDSGNMVFFVGAGISIDSGVPGFGKLNEIVIKSIENGKLNEDERKLLREDIRLRPEVVLQAGVEELDSNIFKSLDMVCNYNPNYNHIFLSEVLRKGNWVFTTNFDNLIEKACKDRGIDFQCCYEEPQFEQFIKRNRLGETPYHIHIERGILFKLHGTIEEEKKGLDRFTTIQVALNQVGQGLFEAKETVLRYFLENYDLCFMGYSCQDDFSVYPVLISTESKKKVFYFDYAKEPVGEPLCDEEELRSQKEKEERKLLHERTWKSWEIISVNSFLLKRLESKGESFKLVGNSSMYVRSDLCQLAGINTDPDIVKMPITGYEAFEQWAKSIDEFQRDLFIGRLFEHIGRWDKAKRYYEEAIGITGRNGREQLVIHDFR